MSRSRRNTPALVMVFVMGLHVRGKWPASPAKQQASEADSLPVRHSSVQVDRVVTGTERRKTGMNELLVTVMIDWETGNMARRAILEDMCQI